MIYAIIKIEELTLIDFSEIGETSVDTIRKSLDGSQFVIKWQKEPSFISSGLVVPVSILTHKECLELMATPEWSEEIEV